MRAVSHPASTQPAVSHRPSLAARIAFVLAGGGSLGAMQVGMMRGLYERGVAPDIFPINPRMVIGGLPNQRGHLVPNRGLRRLAACHLQIERLEHASVPLHLVAFDLLSGREVRLSDCPALDAVLAADAIPGR
jgi:NTE family protein